MKRSVRGTVIDHPTAELCQLVFDETADGIFLSDEDGRLLEVNHSGCEMLGYSRAQLLKKSIQDLIPLQEATTKPLGTTSKRVGERVVANRTFVQKNGKLLPVEVTSRMLQGGTMLAIVRDVSEHKQSEQMLNMLKVTVETASDAAFWLDSEGRFMYVNDSACKSLGYDRSALMTMRLFDINPDSNRRDWENLWSQFSENRTVQIESRHRRSDGTIFPVEVVSTFLTFEGSRYLCGFARDITERRQTEESFRRSETNFRNLADKSMQGIQIYQDQKIVYVNQAMATIMGFTMEEQMSMSAEELRARVHPDDYAVAQERTRKRINGEELSPTADLRVVAKDGSIRWIHAYNNPIEFDGRTAILATSMDITERKHAEESLQKSEQRYRALFNFSPDALYVHVHDRIALVNPTFCKLLGAKDPSELIGKSVFEIVHPDYHDALRQRWQLVYAGELAPPLEETFTRLDGTLVEVEVSAMAVDWEGSRGVQVIVRDITERKRAEKALRESEERYRTIFENVQDVYYETLMDGTILDISPSIESISNGQYSRAEFIGKSVNNLYADITDRERFLAAIQKTGNVADFQVRFKNRDGSTIICSVSAKINFDALGKPQKIVGSLHDISERIRAEQALRESQFLYQSFVEQLPTAAFRKDSSGRYVMVNEQFCRLKGLTAKEFLGKRPLEVANSEPAKLVESGQATKYAGQGEDVHEQIMQTGSIVETEEEYPLPNGVVQYMHVVRMPVFAPDRTVVGTQGILFDVTARKQAEDELRRYQLLSQHTHDIILFVRQRDGQIVEANEAATRAYGYDHHELLTKRISDLRLPSTLVDLSEQMHQASLGDASFETVHLRKDGAPFPVEVSSQGMMLGGERILMGIVRDITERKRVEEALLKRESQLEEAQRIGHIGSWEWDAVKNVTTSSDELYRLFDSEPGSYEFTLERFFESPHPDDRVMAKEHVGRMFETRNPSSFDFRVLRPDGTIRWLHSRSTVTVDDAGQIIRMQGTVEDITERKAANDAVSQERNLLRTLIDSLPETVYIYVKDRESRYLINNRSHLRSLGVSRQEDAIGKTSADFFEPEVAQRIIGEEQEIIRTGIPLVEKEETVRNKALEGSRWHLDTKVPLRDSTGVIVGLVGMSTDITDRKRAEESLLMLSKAVDASGEAIFMTDQNGIFTFVNNAFIALYGYEKVDVLGKTTPRILKSGQQTPEQYRLFWQNLSNKQTTKGEWINRTKDGRMLSIEGTANPILDTKGTIIGFLAIQRDVTQQRNLENQIRQSQKMESLGTLASGVAHDFNKLLGIIMGHASLVERFKDEPERFSESINTILGATRRGASLVRQMLTFARKSEAEIRPLLMNDSIIELQKLLNETFPKTMTIICQLGDRLPLIDADPTQVHQVLLNLCVNARDAMEGNGTLTISTTTVSAEMLRPRFTNVPFQLYVRLEVSDTGSGMDEATRQRIFEPFFTTKGIGKGTGLGLSVVFGIVENHEGLIDVRSHMGEGTTFSLYFPVRTTSDAFSAEPPAANKENIGGTEIILVIEDEEALRESVRMILAFRGYTVLTAEDGEEALAMLNRYNGEIALVLCDYGLPKFSGLEVLKRVRAASPDVKFVLGTGYIDPSDRAAVLNEGANDILQKPYSTAELLKRIRDVLDLD